VTFDEISFNGSEQSLESRVAPYAQVVEAIV
jgi:hypothetical protein